MTLQEWLLSDWYLPQTIWDSARQQLGTKQDLIRNSCSSFSFDLCNHSSCLENAISLLSRRFSILSSPPLLLFYNFIYFFSTILWLPDLLMVLGILSDTGSFPNPQSCGTKGHVQPSLVWKRIWKHKPQQLKSVLLKLPPTLGVQELSLVSKSLRLAQTPELWSWGFDIGWKLQGWRGEGGGATNSCVTLRNQPGTPRRIPGTLCFPSLPPPALA